MLTAGSKIKIVKGCKGRGLDKGTTWQVRSVDPLGADYSHRVRLVLVRLNGSVISLYARHPNRLGDAVVRLNDGRPEHVIEIVKSC